MSPYTEPCDVMMGSGWRAEGGGRREADHRHAMLLIEQREQVQVERISLIRCSNGDLVKVQMFAEMLKISTSVWGLIHPCTLESCSQPPALTNKPQHRTCLPALDEQEHV